MNIKRIGLIGGSGVVGGGTNSGSGGSEDNIWTITDINTLQHNRYNAAITIGSSIVTSHIGKDNTDVIDISADEGIKIERNYKRLIEISPDVSIGTGSTLNKTVFIGSDVFIDSEVFIGSDVYISPGFDSRNISGGSGSNDGWKVGIDSIYVNDINFNVALGTSVRIGSDSDVRIGKYAGINIQTDDANEEIFIGTGVYIEPGFDSRNISGGSSGGGDGLWKIEADLLTSRGSNRNIQLGTTVFIGTQGSVVIDGERHGIKVNTATTTAAILIGTKVKIGTSNETVELGQNSIQINDVFGDESIFIGSQVHIGAGFDSRKCLNSDNDLNPERIPTDSSLKGTEVLGVNIEPQSNGNIKIGDTLFMPATPSGDPMHYAYISAGAEYNDTTDFIVKDAPWKDMVDTIEDKAKWGFDVVDASQVKQMTIGGTTYNYVQTTRQSPEDTVEPRYFIVNKGSNGIWVEDETKVLHIPGHWYLRGLGDITNTEIRRIVENKFIASVWEKDRAIQSIKTRTLLHPYTLNFTDGIKEISNLFGVCIESFGMFDTNFKKSLLECCIPTNSILGNQPNLKYFACLKNLTSITHTNVRVLPINGMNKSIKIDSPIISKQSIRENILNATPTSAIVITLCSDAYTRLGNDSDIIAALEAKNTALEGTGGSISLVSA